MTQITQESTTLQGLKRGDPDLLDELIERYQYRLFRYLLNLTGHRPTAEDLFQETWVRVLEKGHQYKDKWRFDTWLFSVARHLVIDLARRKKTVSLEALLEADERPQEIEATDTTDPLDLVSAGEQRERIAVALDRLPLTCREVVVLRFQEDMRLEEIAQVVEVPLSTVKSRLYRGLEILRGYLEGGRL